MLDCYVTLRVIDASSAGLPFCMASLVPASRCETAFERRWQRLLVKHELTMLDLSRWSHIATQREWDASAQLAVLGEFLEASALQEAVSFLASIDPQVWMCFEPETREAFLTMQGFCFQRSLRTVLDRLEAGQHAGALSVILARDPGSLASLAGLLDSMFTADSRAGGAMTTVSFVDRRSSAHLQCAELMACTTLARSAERTAPAAGLPDWAHALATLPLGADEPVIEYWDETHAAQNAAMLEWLSGSAAYSPLLAHPESRAFPAPHLV